MTVKASDQVTLTDLTDISGSTNYYYSQASTLTAPSKPTTKNPSGWTTTEPTVDTTKSLYTSVRTDWSNGDFTWSDVSLSSSYEAAKAAYNKAVAANATANATAQYFSHDNDGAHVMTTAESPNAGFNSLWTAARLAFRSATTELMTISADLIELGKNSTSAVISMCAGKFRLSYEKLFSSDTVSSAVISSASTLALKSELGSNLAYTHTVDASDVASGTNVVAQGAQLHAMVNTSSYDDFGGAEAGMYVSCSQGTSMHTAQITIVSGCTDKTGADVAPLLIVTSGAKSATVPLSRLYRALSRTVLFDNDAKAFGGAVTLSETAANFDEIEVFFRTNDGFYGSVSVMHPNGKTFECTASGVHGGDVWFKGASFTVSGATIDTYHDSNGYWTGEVNAAGSNSVHIVDIIAITQVVGYRS